MVPLARLVSRWSISTWLPDDTLTKKASLNALAAGLNFCAQVAVGFIINPLLVAGLGTQGYGVWQVLRQLVGYLSPMTGRSRQALKWSIANLQSSPDHEEKRRYVGGTLAISLGALPVLCISGAVLAWFAPLWLGVSPELVGSARIAVGLLVAGLAVGSIVEIPSSVLAGENLAYKRMGFAALIVCVGGAITALALYLDMGLVGVAASPVATTVLSGALALYLTRKHVSWFGVATPSRSLLRRIFGLSLWFLGWSIVTRVAQASDLVVLGILGSVELVSSYALTKFAPDSLVPLVAIVVSGSAPGLGGILGAGGVQQTSRVRSELMALTWLIATVAGVTIVLWNQAFIGLWVGEEHYAGSAANLLITLKMIQWAFIQNDASIIDLTLDLRAKVLSSALSGMLSLAVAAVLVGIFEMGIVGVCIGFITGGSLLTVAYPLIVGRILRIAPSAQLAGLPRPVTTTAALFGLAITLAPYMRTSSWTSLLLGVLATLTLTALVASRAGLSRSQRARIPKRVSMMFRSEGGGRAAEQP